MVQLAFTALLCVQDDRLELPPRLDSYYAVLRGEKTLGVMRESLERAHEQPWRYAYVVHLELETALGQRDDFSATALLDDAFLPLYAEMSRWRNASVEESSILPAGEGRRKLDGPAGLVDLAAEDHALPTLVVYSLRQNGRLARPGVVRARLLPDQEVEIEVGAAEKRDILGRSVTATKLTFSKPPSAPAADFEWVEAWADKYGRLLEVRLRGGARIVLVEGKDAIARLGWLPRDGRRDPLTRPNRRERPKFDGLIVPDVHADAIESLLRDLAKRVVELRRLKEENLRPEGEAVYRGFLGLAKGIRAKANPAQAAVVDDLRNQAEDVWGGAERARQAARALFVQALSRMDQLQVEEMERDVAQLRATGDLPELEGRRERHDVLLWTAEAKAFLLRCRTRRDLAKLVLHVSGTTLSDTRETLPLDLSIQVYGHRAGEALDVPFVRHEVYAIVNGKFYRPGDVIQGTSARLECITRNSVQFSLRDELRDVPLR